VVTIMLRPPPESTMRANSKRPVRVVGFIRQLPTSIHVPRPYSDEFRRMTLYHSWTSDTEPSYRVRVRYGGLLEPRVTGIELQEKWEGK
jgi:hypothetical protein